MKIKNNTDKKDSQYRYRLVRNLLISAVLLLAVIVSAGCITEVNEDVITETCNTPADMASCAVELTADLKNIAISMSIDMYDLSGSIGAAAGSEDDIRSIMLKYYGENPWIEKLIYYDLVDGSKVRVPELASDIYITDYLPVPTQDELESSGGIIHLDCVYIPGNGYVSANYAAVYDSNGNYRGFLILIYDNYVMINLHPIAEDNNEDYGNFACFITDKNNQIVYSSMSEYIGQTIPEDSLQLYTGQCLIKAEDGKLGAYTYTSGAFYNYLLGSTKTTKITSFEDFSYYKSTYTLYLTKETDGPALQYDDVYKIETEEIRQNVIKAYVTASRDAEAAIVQINNGVYGNNVYAMDLDGNVVASTNSESIGLNYINARGTYGSLYTESMVYTAQQGGGYVYYTYPVEPSINPEGTQFTIGYVLSVNENLFVFGYFPGDTDVSPMDVGLRNDVTSVSREIVNEAYEYDIFYIIDLINNNPGNKGELFVKDITHDISDMGVMDTNGYVYASEYYPDLVGTVQTGYTDVYGGSTIRKMIMLAKSGGGLMCDLRETPGQDGYIDLWIYSIEPIDSYYFVISGTVVGTYEDYLSEVLNY